MRSKTDPKIVEDFIDCYEKSTKLWKQMESQFLVDSAYMLPSSGAFIRKKVPPDTENTENNQYMDEVKTQYRQLPSTSKVFIEDEGIRELTQSNQLSRHDATWIGMLSVVTNTLWAVANAMKFWNTRTNLKSI